MDKKTKDFVTGLTITVFITLLFGYIIYQYAIFVPHLTTFSITILAISGSLFYWTLTSYNLKAALLIQLFLLLAFFVIFKNSVSINFIIMEILMFLSTSASIYINYKIFEPRIKTIFLPFTLAVLIIVLSSLAITINFFYIVITTSKVYTYNILLKAIVIEIVQKEIGGLGLGIGIYLSNVLLRKNTTNKSENTQE
jgi:hypothetical protein